MTKNEPFSNQVPEHVVLIHGLAGSRVVMWPLAWRLHNSGYRTSTFGYPSWLWSIEHHASRFTKYLERLESDSNVAKFNIVAHSMGTIITRQTLLHQRFEKLNRIVMLASPNQGSPAARLLGSALPFCKTLRQLSSHPNSFVRNLPEPDFDGIGIVAARHDRVVPQANSHLTIESDHVTVFSGHNGLLVRPSAHRQVIEFLRSGRFNHAKSHLADAA